MSKKDSIPKKVTIERKDCTRCGQHIFPRVLPDGTIQYPTKCTNRKCASPNYDRPTNQFYVMRKTSKVPETSGRDCKNCGNPITKNELRWAYRRQSDNHKISVWKCRQCNLEAVKIG